MDKTKKSADVHGNFTEPEYYLRKRRRAIIFVLVGIWGIYQFSIREDFNLLWIIPAAVLVIVSAYNISIANKQIRKYEQEIVDQA